MIKDIFTVIIALSTFATFSSVSFAETQNHDHSASCTHDHSLHKNEEISAQEDHKKHDHDTNKNHAEHCENIKTNAPDKSHKTQAAVSVTIPDRVRHSIAMELEKITATPELNGKTYYGQMMIPPSSVGKSALPANGRIHFFVRVGQTVSSGTPLYTLSSPDLIEMNGNIKDSEAALKRANAEFSALKLRLERIEKIGVRNSALESELRYKDAEIETLKIATERHRALWKQATTDAIFAEGVLTMLAKYDSKIQTLDLNEGAWGERGTNALTLIKSEPLEFKATAFGHDDFSNAKAQLSIRIGDKNELFSGTLRTATQIDEETQSRVLYFVPENLPKTVYPGQVARLDVTLLNHTRQDFLLVPNSAVIKVGIDNCVFVCDPNNKNTFFVRKVKTLPSRRGKTPVSDIYEGETVVSKGGYELKYILPTEENASPQKTAGHFHADGKFHEGEH